MRILHIIPSISPLDGGPSAALLALTRALARRGLTVDVLTTDGHGVRRLTVPFAKPLTWDGVRHIFFHRQIRFYSVSGVLLVWLIRHARDYNLFHIHGLFSFPSIAAALIARLFRIPYLVQPHGCLGTWGFANRRRLLKSLSFRFVEHPIIRRAASLYLNTDLELQECKEIGITRGADVVGYAMVLPDMDHQALGDSFRRTYPELQSRRFILFLSRIHPKKGLELLLDAFRIIKSRIPDVFLAIVGDGEPQYMAKLKASVDEHGLSSDVRFLGFLSGEMKWSALAAADLFVLPTHSENFGIAVVEAMAAGTPVVVTPGAAISFHVKTAGGGAVVERDAQAMSEAIVNLLSDETALQRLGEEAKRASKAFSSDQVAIRTRDIYARIVGARIIGGDVPAFPVVPSGRG